MNKPILIATAALTLLTTACATPETRVRNALTSAGLPQPVAACMADRMVDRLSYGQLNKLSGLKKLKSERAGDTTVNEFIKRAKALRDPEILGVVSSSGLICAVRG